MKDIVRTKCIRLSSRGLSIEVSVTHIQRLKVKGGRDYREETHEIHKTIRSVRSNEISEATLSSANLHRIVRVNQRHV